MKLNLQNISNLQNETTVVSAITANNEATASALENTLSRDGTNPNQMNDNLDMNSNPIINLPSPISPLEPVRVIDLAQYATGGSVSFEPLPIGGTKGQILVKTSANNYDVNWENPTILTPEMFGAVTYNYGVSLGSMVVDSSDAIQAAIDALPSGGTVQLGVGVYRTTKPILIKQHGISIRGQGRRSTNVVYQPSVSGGAAFLFKSINFPAFGLYWCGLSDLSIGSADQTHIKFGVQAVDTSFFNLERVVIGSYPAGAPGSYATSGWYEGGGASVGVLIQGRENGYFNEITSASETAIKIEPNPALPAGLMDSYWFGALTLAAPDSHTLIDMGDAAVFNTVFEGPNNWLLGGTKFKWIRPGAGYYSSGLIVRNVKSEQAPVGSGYYTFHLENSPGLYGFKTENIVTGDTWGARLRNVKHAYFSNWDMRVPTGGPYIGLDIEATADTFQMDQMSWHPSIISAISGLYVTQAEPSTSGSTIPIKAFYKVFNNESLMGPISSTGSLRLYSGTGIPVGGVTGQGISISNTGWLGIYYGSGVPTLAANAGSLYIRTDGSSTSTRLYINTDSGTTWTNVVTAI